MVKSIKYNKLHLLNTSVTVLGSDFALTPGKHYKRNL